MEKKLRKFTITTDKDCGGFGYSRIKDNTHYIHTIMLFMFIIIWTRPVKTGKKQIARQVSNRCVEINSKFYDVKYYSNIDDLKHIWYRNKLNTFIKITEFSNYKPNWYVINSPDKAKDEIVNDEDIYLFHPDSKLEGYIKDNVFYAVKELSVG